MFSYSFLLLLRAHLTYFITRLIGRILTEKRIEAQQKKRVRSDAPQARRSLKVWIPPSNFGRGLTCVDRSR